MLKVACFFFLIIPLLLHAVLSSEAAVTHNKVK